MQLRYNYRAYPDASQRRALASAFGCARVVWNDCLRDRKEAHAAGLPYVKSAELSRLRITQAKRTEERAWLADVSAVVLQQSLRDLDTAYKNFFDSIKGKRKGRKIGPPRYKSKKDTRQSIRFNTNAFSLHDDGTVYVAKVGNLKVTWSRRLPAAPTSLTVTKDSCGRYFLSFVVDTEPDILPEAETDTGIDLGLSAFAVLSDGTKISTPRFLRRAEKKLKRLQRELSRKTKGSKNRAKARIKVAPARARGRPAPGLPPQGIHSDHSRQPSGVRGRPRGVRSRPNPARQVRARRGMVRVREHAGVQGGSARPHIRQGGPCLPVLAGLLGLRLQGRSQAPARPAVDVRRMRHRARPRPQRSPQRPLRRTPYRRRRTGGDTKRLWSAGKTGTRARTAR
jgi:hypothetical protein